MKQEMLNALNEHINFEMHSGYIYLQLALIMEENNYKGYATWLSNHYFEELNHAQLFIKYLQDRNQKPVLTNIECPQFNVKTPLEVAKLIYEHEQKVSSRIYGLTELARDLKDYASEVFLHTFIQEQTEEEDLTRDIVDKFELAADSIAAIMYVDANINKK